MPQTITMGYKALVAEAESRIETVSVEEAQALHGNDAVVFVDLRDPRELEREGRMPGAFHCPRGMLEFWIDPESPHAKPVFSQDKRFVFFCGGGWRSALAAQVHPHVQRSGGVRAQLDGIVIADPGGGEERESDDVQIAETEHAAALPFRGPERQAACDEAARATSRAALTL